MRKLIAVAAMAFAIAACAKKQQPGDLDLSPKIAIVVVNNVTPLDQFTVYMVSSSGGQQVLGTASPNRSQRFAYQPVNATDKFILVAQSASGRKLSSQQFSLQNLSSLTWDIRANIIQFFEP